MEWMPAGRSVGDFSDPVTDSTLGIVQVPGASTRSWRSGNTPSIDSSMSHRHQHAGQVVRDDVYPLIATLKLQGGTTVGISR